ncbi:DEAD/DEAH box helicase [Reinekea marinisedimentorum]|uniref:DEAD-box ATP-dependent RNA helicase RhpA n=1 Tax=Reinekea marinisedimentorum TaxID=230495 RepID=A0A4R3ICW6_9GAMM|nr:DEAD/DEAH box helicase [Reinekea marinisedimentorum]TCS44035.1 ATP-dependent RNA helicase RhlE [Reinekea marinisedimentorum]
MSFSQLGLIAPLLKAVTDQGYSDPTDIQRKAIPEVLNQRDLLASAQTGTGKTAGFTLPMLQNLTASKAVVRSNQVRALVLTPTRELAAQVQENVLNYSKHLPMRSAVVFGGVKINPQMMTLRRGVDVLVATPGRLLDLYQQNAVKFDQLEILVLDEADRMLDMGFIHDIKKILRLLPQKRQNLMFSATFSDEVRALAKTIVNDPVEVSVATENTTAKTVSQLIIPVDKSNKPALLCQLIKDHNWHQVLVFSRTKHGANRLATRLEKAGISAAAIHGNKSQGARTRALADFKSGDVQVLVATDIAARGLDIHELPHVINFDLPNVPADYVHRIGRTGRAKASGEAVSFVDVEEIELLAEIQNLIGEVLAFKTVEGFEPSQAFQPPALNLKPKKIKKPKKPKAQKAPAQAEQAASKPKPRRRPRRRNKKPDSL